MTVPPGWKVYTPEDAFAPRPPRAWLAERTFVLPSLNVLYASPGSLKSMIALDLSVCVVAGVPWLAPEKPGRGDAGRAVTQGPVLWVDLDVGTDEMHGRVEAACRTRGVRGKQGLFYLSMPDPIPDFTKWKTVLPVLEVAKDAGARLIVIDNLGYSVGSTDENAPAMAGVMRNFRTLTARTGACVLLIHHERKMTGLHSRAGDRLRGHTSIEGALDLALLMERPTEDSPEVTIRATKNRGPAVEQFGATFDFTHKPDTTELETFRFYGCEAPQSAAAIRSAVLEVVEQSGGLTKGDLTKEVQELLPQKPRPVGVNRVREAIDELARKLMLRVEVGPHAAQLFFPADDPWWVASQVRP